MYTFEFFAGINVDVTVNQVTSFSASRKFVNERIGLVTLTKELGTYVEKTNKLYYFISVLTSILSSKAKANFLYTSS